MSLKSKLIDFIEKELENINTQIARQSHQWDEREDSLETFYQQISPYVEQRTAYNKVLEVINNYDTPRPAQYVFALRDITLRDLNGNEFMDDQNVPNVLVIEKGRECLVMNRDFSFGPKDNLDMHVCPIGTMENMWGGNTWWVNSNWFEVRDESNS